MPIKLSASKGPWEVIEKLKKLKKKKITVVISYISLSQTGHFGENEYRGSETQVESTSKLLQILEHGLIVRGDAGLDKRIKWDPNKRLNELYMGKYVELPVPKGRSYFPFSQSREFIPPGQDPYGRISIESEGIVLIKCGDEVVFNLPKTFGDNYHVEREFVKLDDKEESRWRLSSWIRSLWR